MGTRVYVGGLSSRCREDDVEKFFKGFGSIREVILKNGFCFVEFEDSRDASDAAHDLNGREFQGNRVNVELARGLPRGRDRSGDGGGDYGGDRNRDRGNGGGGYRDRGGRGFDRRDGGGGGRYGGGGFRGGDRGFGGGGGRSFGGGRGNFAPPSRTPHRVVVENLSSGVSWQDLKDFMRQAGEVVYTDVFSKKNEGVVEFASLQDMRTALEKLDGREMNGRKIKLVEERKRDSARSPEKSSSDRNRNRSTKSKSRSRSRTRSRSPPARKRRSRSSSRSRSASKSKSPVNKRKSSSVDDDNDADKKDKSDEAIVKNDKHESDSVKNAVEDDDEENVNGEQRRNDEDEKKAGSQSDDDEHDRGGKRDDADD